MNYEEIKKLMDDMGNSKLASLNIEFLDGTKINMEKNESQTNVSLCADTHDALPLVAPVPEKNYCLIKSPMVGIFYSRSSPDKEPFVKVGDVVKKGQPLCIVEAMKLMNEIEAECDGEITDICVKDEQMIEYGQILFKIMQCRVGS